MKRILYFMSIIIISIFILSSCSPLYSPESTNSQKIVSDPANLLVLVNKKWALPKDYVPSNLITPRIASSKRILLRSDAAKSLEELFGQAKKQNIQLIAVSGYRSYKNQERVMVASNKANGVEHTSRYVADPGKSEHQTGLAIDVNKVTNSFENSREAKWLANHCAEYGFIIRYPKGKEEITGFAYEPWHIRYVGTNAAKTIKEKNITLEEYLGEGKH